MIVYVLLCYYDNNTEMCGVFSTLPLATAEAKRMEQNNEVDVGNWVIKSERVQ